MWKLKSQRGSFIIWLTLAFALLGTFIGFALDFGRAYLEKARIARLVDAAALTAAKVLKGQAGLENDATRAACDSMSMNGVSVQMNGNNCVSTEGAFIQATVEFFDLPVPGSPPVRAVRVTGSEPVSTTFLRFLGWMVPGNYSSINVVARAEAGPERPVDLMLILDRSGSMNCDDGCQDGTGTKKIVALKTTVNAFLGLQETFSANDRIGMISFSSRGCGVNGVDTTAAVCTPDVPMDFATAPFLETLKTKINGLTAGGGTNTMEALRTARAPIANSFADETRAAARKAVLLVTDGQPTFLIRDNDTACKRDPMTNATLPSPGDGNGSSPNEGPFPDGCKHGVTAASQMVRQILSNTGNTDASLRPYIENGTVYLNTIRCARSLTGCSGTNGAMNEANLLRNCGFANSDCSPGGAHDVLIFVIAIGKPEPAKPQNSLDDNAKCLLARIANATDVLDAATGAVTAMAQHCNNVSTTSDNDTHADLVQSWPCGTGPCINSTQEKGKVFTVDLSGNVTDQLSRVFDEIAAILKLRLVL